MRKQPCCVSFYLMQPWTSRDRYAPFALVMMTRALMNAYSLKVGTRKHIIADSAYDRGD